MDTRKLEQGTRLFGELRWSPILTGVFLALAAQAVLQLLGLAIAQSSGDGVPGNGYGVWSVIVQLVAIAFGAAVAASMSYADRRTGIVAGIMVWAVGLVLGGFVTGLTLGTRLDEGGAWSAFFGALLGLGAAILGGLLGSRIGGPTTSRIERPLPASDYTAQQAL